MYIYIYKTHTHIYIYKSICVCVAPKARGHHLASHHSKAPSRPCHPLRFSWNWSPARRPSETPRPCPASPGGRAAGSGWPGGRRPAGRFRCGSDPTSAWAGKMWQWQLGHCKKHRKNVKIPKTSAHDMILKELKITRREMLLVRVMNRGILLGRALWTRFNTRQAQGQEQFCNGRKQTPSVQVKGIM